MFCQKHGKKRKEYSCLTCNKPICADCLAIGKHIGHEVSNFKKGYEKVITDFKTHLSEYETTLKLLDEKKTPVMSYLEDTLKEVNSMKQKIIEDSQSLMKTIEDRTKEMIAIADSETESFSKSLKLLKKPTEEFKGMTEKCSESINKAEAANGENYYKFSKNAKN